MGNLNKENIAPPKPTSEIMSMPKHRYSKEVSYCSMHLMNASHSIRMKNLLAMSTLLVIMNIYIKCQFSWYEMISTKMHFIEHELL